MLYQLSDPVTTLILIIIISSIIIIIVIIIIIIIVIIIITNINRRTYLHISQSIQSAAGLKALKPAAK